MNLRTDPMNIRIYPLNLRAGPSKFKDWPLKKKAIQSNKSKYKNSKKTLETNNEHNITKFFNKHNNHFGFEKTLEIDQTIENGKQHEKK